MKKKMDVSKVIQALDLLLNSETRKMNFLTLLEWVVTKSIENNDYPDGLGELFFELFPGRYCDIRDDVFSTTKITSLFYLILRVSLFANDDQIFDVTQFFMGFDSLASRYGIGISGYPARPDNRDKALDSIMKHTSKEALTQKIYQQYDNARANYSFNLSIGKNLSYDEFLLMVFDFYTYTQLSVGQISKEDSESNHDQLLSEVAHVVNEVFSDNGGIKSAYVIAKDNIQGGIGTIFDKITEYLKSKETNLYIHLVFQKNFAPLEWEKRISVVKNLMVIVGPWLSSTVLSQPPESYANNLEPLIKGYVRSLENFQTYMTIF